MAQIQPERALECIFAGRYEKNRSVTRLLTPAFSLSLIF
ncbi:hypothetical protein A464_3780 [Salmonella bongori N268-08]|uniref:Uncharacterized protein n=1 Tax=Salmonella bongori N268-08 TaxID=1197719 RepID=S5N250_SALBN|nr:hypothetical protein A464_3780 [Salmonella bongori N268-08]